MILDSLLWKMLLRRDPAETLYHASLHVLESHQPDEAGVSDALHELLQARQRILAARFLAVVQTSVSEETTA